MSRVSMITLIALILSITATLFGQAVLPQGGLQGGFGAAVAAADVQSSTAQACQAYHKVKRGETLSRIGLRYGVPWREIAAANKLANPNRIFAGQILCIPGKAIPDTGAPAKIPTFSITSVVRDQTVTIQTANFPANMKFDVLMGAYGTRGVRGTYVTTIDSGQGGSFSGTYSIPAGLHGSRRIAIRLQSATGYFSYNWFFNTSTR